MKCTECDTRISITWLFLALPWSKYTCKKCGTIFAGTLFRFISITAEISLLGYLAIRSIKGRTSPIILLPLIVLGLMLILLDLPGQIKKVE
jgi:hypothetical protein